ncbi:uncharacterized protein LOC126370683 isoform X1 [Pectinophora gossypiella]|uniref:uncharacterized protein LOC126370683 isoform X1 n=1 Tax=Pectinophora gossypiella TaxID=13191 RepID=UPI00214E3E1B|nr:uncharacterized protein LOC126370683 isoform X1 [Pectinophora gossypiella]
MGKCVVPGCNNAGHHALPKNINQRELWLKAMKFEGQVKNTIKKSVCTQHFKDSDYMDAEIDLPNMQRRRLKKHAVPSVFPWSKAPLTETSPFIYEHKTIHDIMNSDSQKKNIETKDPLPRNDDNISKIKSSKIQSSEVPKSSWSDLKMKCEPEFSFNVSGVKSTYVFQNIPSKYMPELPGLMTDPVKNTPIQQDPDPLSVQEIDNQESTEIDMDVANSIDISEFVEVKQEEDSSDNIENNATTVTRICPTCGELPFYSVHYYKNEANGVNFYTGLENFDKLMFVFMSLGNGVNNLNYIYEQPPVHLDPLEQFCMVLLILKRHREFEDVAMTHKTSVKQVTNIFITWIKFMALQWRTIDLMPLEFNDTYPHNGMQIDASDSSINTPCQPITQEITFSTYNNGHIKLLIGVTLSGLITDISPCYGEKESNEQNIILSNKVRADMPEPKLNKDNQVSPKPSTKHKIRKRGKKSANKNVHVERVIGMLKTYKILTEAMNETEKLLSSDIAFVVAMLVNFRSNNKNNNNA